MIEELITALADLRTRIADLERTERPLIATGLQAWTGAAAASGSIVINFGVTFNANPRLYVNANNSDANICANIVTSSVTQATIQWKTIDASTKTAINFDWLAIGG